MPPRKPRLRKARSRPDGEKKEGAPPAPSAVELAIRYLGSRRRFEKEVRSHLRRKGVAPFHMRFETGQI